MAEHTPTTNIEWRVRVIDSFHAGGHQPPYYGPFIGDDVWRVVADSVVKTLEQDLVEEKLERIGGFHSGWHFGEGFPMRSDAMHCARQLHKFGKALDLVADVFPHEDGDVSIMFKADDRYLEVLCLPDMKFSLTLERGTEHPFTLMKENKENEEATLADVFTELLTFAKPESLWNFFDSFALTNTVRLSDDLHPIAFGTLGDAPTEPLSQRTNVGSALSTPIAYGNASHLNLFANTSWRDMARPELSEGPLSTGDYPLYLPMSKWPEKKGQPWTLAIET